MFDLNELQNTLNDFIASPVVQIGIRAIGLYIALIWLASAFWAYRDMRNRSNNPVAPYLAAALVVVFTPVLFPFGLLLYRIVRPKETLAEANDRALAEEAMLAEVASKPHCANCARPVHEDWILCPTCRNRLRRVCPDCERLCELDWSICAWCGKDFERAEPIAAAYMPPAVAPGRPPGPGRPRAPELARPAPRLPSTEGSPGGASAAGTSAVPRPSVSPASQPLAGER
jgi:RNA polymerase subunit RPABC4/transcription elongation factor Spt4